MKNKEYYKIYGGKNKIKFPFNIGSTIIRGTEKYVFLGMDDDLMLMQPINQDALYQKSTINNEIMETAIKLGYTPKLENQVKLHYMYADSFKLENE